jgi:hypothetical protein
MEAEGPLYHKMRSMLKEHMQLEVNQLSLLLSVNFTPALLPQQAPLISAQVASTSVQSCPLSAAASSVASLSSVIWSPKTCVPIKAAPATLAFSGQLPLKTTNSSVQSTAVWEHAGSKIVLQSCLSTKRYSDLDLAE